MTLKTTIAALAAVFLTSTAAHAAPYCLNAPRQIILYSAVRSFIAGGTFNGMARCTSWAPFFMQWPGGRICQGQVFYGWNQGHAFACRMYTLRVTK